MERIFMYELQTAPKTGILSLSLEAHDLHTHLFHVKKNL
jgi:hypothetical protein